MSLYFANVKAEAEDFEVLTIRALSHLKFMLSLLTELSKKEVSMDNIQNCINFIKLLISN